MDAIFRALSDPIRRRLLDSLKANDGQTQGELEQGIPEITRFAVMKHLKILEAANLISTERQGRRKHHYLNAVPIQEIADRWIARFAKPWSEGLADLKTHLERNEAMSKPKHRLVTVIQTTPEKLWAALTQPEMTRQYFFGLSVTTDWRVGADLTYLRPDGNPEIRGEVLEVIPNRKLVYSFNGECAEENQAGDPPSRVTFEIEPMGAACKLILVHDGFDTETTTYEGVGNGWPLVLSGLKTLLETGKPLDADAS